MKVVEKVAALVGVLVIVFGMGVAWSGLNGRIDRVDEKIGAIQKMLGSSQCSAILSRQMEAIEKNKAAAREALETLSEQYRCVSSGSTSASVSEAMDRPEPVGDPRLQKRLEQMDALLDDGN
jgi:hypothetical protein